jgi:hypothetical protein
MRPIFRIRLRDKFEECVSNESREIQGPQPGTVARDRSDRRKDLLPIYRAWRDSNPQPSDPKSEALSG